MLQVFAVYDSKAEAYLQPIFCVNRAVAIRSFTLAAQQEGHDFNRYAADYTLFQLGEWDPYSGNFNLLEKHSNLGKAAEFISAQER